MLGFRESGSAMRSAKRKAKLYSMFRIKTTDKVNLSTIYSRLKVPSLASQVSLNRLRCYGHVERSDKWIKHCTHLEVEGCKGRGRLVTVTVIKSLNS